MAVYNDLCKGITVQKSLLFWQYGFFNPIHTNEGHQMPPWLDDGPDRVSIDFFYALGKLYEKWFWNRLFGFLNGTTGWAAGATGAPMVGLGVVKGNLLRSIDNCFGATNEIREWSWSAAS